MTFDPNTDATMDFHEAQSLVLKAAEIASGLTAAERESLPFALATVLVRNKLLTASTQT